MKKNVIVDSFSQKKW